MNMSRNDSLGSTYTLNGFMAFCSVNNNKLDAGDSAISDATAIVTPADLLTATVTLTSVAFSIAYTATPLAAGVRLFIFVSPQRSAGVKFNGDYRLLAITAAAAASPANVLAAYTAKFGAPVGSFKPQQCVSGWATSSDVKGFNPPAFTLYRAEGDHWVAVNQSSGKLCEGQGVPAAVAPLIGCDT